MAKIFAVNCQITRSAFSQERVFSIDLGNNQEHVGAAFRGYFRSKNGQPIGDDEPPAGRTIEGKELIHPVRRENGRVMISLPDGEVLSIADDHLIQVPVMEDSPDVFVEP